MFGNFSLKTAALAGALALTTTQVQAQALSAESGNPTTFNSQLATLLSKYVGQDYDDLSMQLSTGQNLAMAGVKLGTGRIDLTMIPTELYSYMGEGSHMYASLGDQAKQAAENLRSLFGYVHGAHHILAWGDSGIDSWEDIAGKKVYTGPASSAASAAMEQIIEANTGMAPGEGYVPVTMGWGASGQAFSDGQVDVLLTSARVGSSVIDQYSLVDPIRVLGITDEAQQSEAWKALMAKPGQLTVKISNDTYPNMVNEEDEITLLAFTMMAIVNQSMDEETAYRLTKAFWDHAAEMRESGPIFEDLRIEDAFTGVNAPLHPGAYRYYQEQDVDVPELLIPADA